MHDSTDQYDVLHERGDIVSGTAQYVLSVVAVSILCGLIQVLAGKEGVHSGVVKMMTGVVLTVAVFSPVTKVEFTNLEDYIDTMESMRDTAVWDGELRADDSLRDIITEKTRTYIMDRAAELGATLQVEVSLNSEELPTPDTVTISGEISPYVKQQLTQIIQKELGIPKERQEWM